VSDTANPLTTGIRARATTRLQDGRLARAIQIHPCAIPTLSRRRALGLSYDETMKDVEVVSTVRMMIVRTRFIDEALEKQRVLDALVR
jgi:hypothetical protein